MFANNEIRVLQPVEEIGRLCRETGVLFHTDAAQAAGKVAIDVEKMNPISSRLADIRCTVSKGIGILYARHKNPRVQLEAIIDGGGHERGMRSGTLNVPGIVGLGEASELCVQELAEESQRIAKLRDLLMRKFTDHVDGVQIHGSVDHRLPGNLNMSFLYVEGESLLTGIDEVAVSGGAACTPANTEPSYVLKALGRDDDAAQSSLQFSLGRFNTETEMNYVADKVILTVKKLRELSPLYAMAKKRLAFNGELSANPH